MRQYTLTSILIISFLFGSSGVCWSADFQKGVDAANKGDFATAIKEWTPLARQGDVVAQFNLGLTYHEGQAVPQDYKTAMKWYSLAAQQGNADAYFNMGVMYYNGQGVSVDDLRAHMWFDLSATAGNEGAAINRDRIAETMTPSQVAQAKKLVQECLATNYKGC